MEECRHARGKRYSLQCVLTLALAARLAGYRGVTAFAQFASLPPETLQAAVTEWARRHGEPGGEVPPNESGTDSSEASGKACGLPPACMDGKDIRGASRQAASGRRMQFAAVEQGSGPVPGQLEIDSKTNEIPALRQLAAGLDLAGRNVTADALHVRQKTARCLLEDCRADSTPSRQAPRATPGDSTGRIAWDSISMRPPTTD